MEITKIVLFLYVWMDWSMNVQCGDSVRERADKQTPQKWRLFASNIRKMDKGDRRQQMKKQIAEAEDITWKRPCKYEGRIVYMDKLFAPGECTRITPEKVQTEQCVTDGLSDSAVKVIDNKKYQIGSLDKSLFCVTQNRTERVECFHYPSYRRTYLNVEIPDQCICMKLSYFNSP